MKAPVHVRSKEEVQPEKAKPYWTLMDPKVSAGAG
jgi:hypothetical protein